MWNPESLIENLQSHDEHDALATIEKAKCFDEIMTVFSDRGSHYLDKVRRVFDICREYERTHRNR